MTARKPLPVDQSDELVFLVGFAFADVGYAWLMKTVNFARVGTLLALNAVIEAQGLLMDLQRFR